MAKEKPVQIAIDKVQYNVPQQVRDLLGKTTVVRDMLANAILEWRESYYLELKGKEKDKQFHWAELKLVDFAEKLIKGKQEQSKGEKKDDNKENKG